MLLLDYVISKENNMLKLTIDNKPSQKDMDIIENGLTEYNKKKTGLHEPPSTNAVYIKDGDKIKGGVVFVCMKPWTYVKQLWVSEELRGTGYGAKLLAAAEYEARRQGSSKVMLDTFSFQAPEFYKKKGYTVISKIEGFPINGAERYWLTKKL